MKKVLVFGTFDPLHKGHLSFFKQAKKFGNYLIVVVSPDEKIRSEKKREPRQLQDKRIEAIKQTGLANEIILGEGSGEYNLIDKINPDIMAIGYDQKIPATLKDKLKKYKIVKLKPFKPGIYKSSKLGQTASFYIMRSLRNKRYYYGSTANLHERLRMHNSGRVKSTKPYIPWEIIYKEEFSTIKRASAREYQIKSWRNRKSVEKLINSAGGPII